MVTPDWGAPKAPTPTRLEFQSAESGFARPRERVAAAIIDHCVLLFPVYLMLSAPFKREVTEGTLIGADAEVYLGSLGMVATAATLLLAYQTLSVYFMGATAGQRLFGLRVRSAFDGRALTFWACLVRALGWMFVLSCSCVPCLAVFSDARRRPIHDRLADACVSADRPSTVPPPGPGARRSIEAVYLALVGVCAMSAALRITGVIASLGADRLGANGRGEECDVVSSAVPEASREPHVRLKAALTLYSAGLAERSCLHAELDREHAERVSPTPLSYLAQAFVNADDADLSNQYLDEACAKDETSSECVMSRLVTAWSDDKWAEVESLLKTAPVGSGYMEVWAVRHYMQRANPAAALTWLDRLSEHREVGEFVMGERVRALFDGHRADESKIALAQAVAGLPEDTSLELRGWTCSQNLQDGCEALASLACTPFTKDALADPAANQAEPVSVSLARVMARECKGAVNYAALEDEAQGESFNAFLRANAKYSAGDEGEGLSLYRALVEGDDTPDLLRVEASRRLLAHATLKQAADLKMAWNKLDSRVAWAKIGNLLAAHFAKLGEGVLARDIAATLADQLAPAAALAIATLNEPDLKRRPASAEAR